MTGPVEDQPDAEARVDAADQLLDEGVEIALFIDVVADQHTAWFRARLMDLRGDILAMIARMDPTEPSNLAHRMQRLELLIGEAQAIISEAFVAVRERTEEVLTAVAETSQSHFSELIAGLLLIKGLSGLKPREELVETARDTMVSGATTRTWAARQSGDMQFRLARALRDAMASDGVRTPSLDTLVAAVRGPAVGPGGIFKTQMRDAESLVRTAVHAVANRVRMEAISSHPELFKQFQHISVIDQVTSALCKPRHLLRWDMDGKPVGHSKPFRLPPLHFRCRSHVVPIMARHEDLPDRIRKRTDPENFDGKPPTDVHSLDEWLEKRNGPVDQQKLLRMYRKALDDLTSSGDAGSPP